MLQLGDHREGTAEEKEENGKLNHNIREDIRGRSLAASARRTNRADHDYTNQDKHGGKYGVDDHSTLLKS
jgi:hypothetical protein